MLAGVPPEGVTPRSSGCSSRKRVLAALACPARAASRVLSSKRLASWHLRRSRPRSQGKPLGWWRDLTGFGPR
eukprot:4866451-Heterocapsa_arctica.AAC.1